MKFEVTNNGVTGEERKSVHHPETLGGVTEILHNVEREALRLKRPIWVTILVTPEFKRGQSV